MEVINKIIDKLPFPIIIALGIIIVAMWIIKQFHGWDNYQKVFKNKIFILVCLLVAFVTSIFYLTQMFTRKFSEKTVINTLEISNKPLSIDTISDILSKLDKGNIDFNTISQYVERHGIDFQLNHENIETLKGALKNQESIKIIDFLKNEVAPLLFYSEKMSSSRLILDPFRYSGPILDRYYKLLDTQSFFRNNEKIPAFLVDRENIKVSLQFVLRNLGEHDIYYDSIYLDVLGFNEYDVYLGGMEEEIKNLGNYSLYDETIFLNKSTLPNFIQNQIMGETPIIIKNKKTKLAENDEQTYSVSFDSYWRKSLKVPPRNIVIYCRFVIPYYFSNMKRGFAYSDKFYRIVGTQVNQIFITEYTFDEFYNFILNHDINSYLIDRGLQGEKRKLAAQLLEAEIQKEFKKGISINTYHKLKSLYLLEPNMAIKFIHEFIDKYIQKEKANHETFDKFLYIDYTERSSFNDDAYIYSVADLLGILIDKEDPLIDSQFVAFPLDASKYTLLMNIIEIIGKQKNIKYVDKIGALFDSINENFNWSISNNQNIVVYAMEAIIKIDNSKGRKILSEFLAKLRTAQAKGKSDLQWLIEQCKKYLLSSANYQNNRK